MPPHCIAQKMTWNRVRDASWLLIRTDGAPRVTRSPNQERSQLNWTRTQGFKYQLKPRVISVARLLNNLGLASWSLPALKISLSMLRCDIRATNSHAPGDKNGCIGSYGRSGFTAAL